MQKSDLAPNANGRAAGRLRGAKSKFENGLRGWDDLRHQSGKTHAADARAGEPRRQA
jgi:hypothetical protein